MDQSFLFIAQTKTNIVFRDLYARAYGAWLFDIEAYLNNTIRDVATSVSSTQYVICFIIKLSFSTNRTCVLLIQVFL